MMQYRYHYLASNELQGMRKAMLYLLLFLPAVVQPLNSLSSPCGVVVGWGDNVSGEATGVPSLGTATGVVTIAGEMLTNAVAITAGMKHGLALRRDGTVVGWGLNNGGQATGSLPAYVGRASGAVMIGNEVLSNVIAIAAGRGESQAIKGNGTIVAWGTEYNGGTIRIPSELEDVDFIAAPYRLAVKADGTVVNWIDGHGVTISGLSNIMAISAPISGAGPFVALQRDGTVITGSVRGSELVSSDVITSNATAVAAGWQNLALKADRTVFSWGSDNYYPVPSGLTNVVAVAVGDWHSLALKDDGTVTGWGRGGFGAASVPAGLSNVVAIAAGNGFSLAITTNPAVAARFMREVK